MISELDPVEIGKLPESQMPRFLIKWLIMALTILAIPHLVGGVIVENFAVALAVAAVLAVLNIVVKPILILLTLPLTILSLGFFLLVLNAFMFQMAPFFVSGFSVESFWSAFVASLVISFVSWLANTFDEGRPRWHFSTGRRVVRPFDASRSQDSTSGRFND